jgi:zinc protease
MINRTLAPAFKQVEQISLIKAEPITLDNGLKTFIVNAGDQDLIRIELIFKNVDWDVKKPLQASAVNAMLNDGTSKLTAEEIAEKIDYYGAFLQTDYNFDHSAVSLYTLNKHLAAVLPVVKAVVSDSVFPQVELDTLIRNHKQKLSVSLEKNDFISRRALNKAIFGDTIYGYTVEATDYDRLVREDLLDYFRKAYQPQNCTLIVAGNVTEDTIKLLNNFFGKDWDSSQPFIENSFAFKPGSGKEHYFEKPEALQSAMRLGQLSVNRNHPDFPDLQVLNTILGGYFGSRLMANIREDKGYTYSIGSAIISLENAGYFFIASEVGTEVCSAALSEIQKEVNRLRIEIVSEEELSLVKNYMLGSMLGGLENVFSHADKFKNIYFFGLGYDYFERYMDRVKHVTAVELQALANKYFNFDQFEKVIVGKK